MIALVLSLALYCDEPTPLPAANIEQVEAERWRPRPRPPEPERFHPLRKLFRAAVEFICGLLGAPAAAMHWMGTLEIAGLICVGGAVVATLLLMVLLLRR